MHGEGQCFTGGLLCNEVKPLAWIEVHQGIFRHRKTLKLASLLDIPRMSAAGHMISLWHWAIDNAPDGDLSHLDDAMIALGADWPESTAPFFVQAIKQAAFVDQDGMIHDWMNYAGKLVERRKLDAQRKRNERASKGQPPSSPGEHPLDSTQDILEDFPSESAPTVQYSTVPNHYIYTLRNIPGWTEKGEPHLATLLAWKEEKGITDDQMERSAIGLSGAASRTLKGYGNLVAALQVRINKGWDGGVKLTNVNGRQEEEDSTPDGPGTAKEFIRRHGLPEPEDSVIDGRKS